MGKRRRWRPSNWASRRPFGIGEQRPNNYFEVFRAAHENRDEAAYAWRILRDGVCDGCALGTSGLRDWTLDGVHLCNVRLRMLRLNTAGPLDESLLHDAAALRERSSAELRELGRLAHPMVRRGGEQGFTRVGWEEALEIVTDGIRAAGAESCGFYLTSRGMPNEAYYAAQKAVRAIGTNSIDNAARICHAPSTYALKQALGVMATTCSYEDWLDSDLIAFIGSNVANNQPVTMKYLHQAKRGGTRVLVVNPYREPGMDRYWVPSIVESALFGTKVCDRFFGVNVGGDVALLSGALKALVESNRIDRSFVERHTTEFEALRDWVERVSWEELELTAGCPATEMRALADELAAADRAILVWSMGITQHEHGEDNVRAIVNLALSQGFVGRDGCGLMPIRGHSGVQGGAELGCYATALPGGRDVDEANAGELSEAWGFDVPSVRGLTAPEMIDAAGAGELEVLFSAGGNFLEVMPDPAEVRAALARIPIRVHMDLVLSSQMLVDGTDAVVLLPAATRYETPGGVTQTSTERRIIFSPEIEGRRIGEARPEWEVFLELARRVQPELADRLDHPDTASLREEIARIVPMYAGIERLEKKGDQVQYGGRHLCAGGEFPMPDSRARFLVPELPATDSDPGRFRLSTRRGKQFNSMVQEAADPITGAARDAVLINEDDARRLELADGARVLVRSETGELRGRVRYAPIVPGNLQVHWPEGNVLIGRGIRSAGAGMPDFNAAVTLEPTP